MVIELILIGDSIDKEYLSKKISQAEELTGRKVSYRIVNTAESEAELGFFNPADLLPLWNINEVELTAG